MDPKQAVPATERSKTAGEGPLEHIFKASRYSFDGLGATFKHELAFRIEVCLISLLIPVALLLPMGLLLKVLIISSMLLVLIVELLNSSMEWVVDYISLEKHPYAKRAKDMGSAAVMLALLNCGLFWSLGLGTVLGWVSVL